MTFDIIVIGAGPAGQKAAIQGAKSKQRVLLVEEVEQVGGECVRRGTIPSKTLRETAAALRGFRARTGMSPLAPTAQPSLESLMTRMHTVIDAHVGYIRRQLARNDVELWRGRARFENAKTIEVRDASGTRKAATAKTVIIATGSRPRTPTNVPVDHERILDSDSILSMTYLPETLTVLGGGVIASEYASIFASLGTRVTMVDRAARPLVFLDQELTDVFTRSLAEAGSTFLGGDALDHVAWDGGETVVTTLASGRRIESEKVLCALCRVANLAHLDIQAAGLAPDARGLLEVDASGRTRVPGIYGAGDVIGPPALASVSMDQGRRAVRHALGFEDSTARDFIPTAVYTIPEMASVGLTEAQAEAELGAKPMVGRARFDEIARGHISASSDGLLKLVSDPTGETLLGVHIAGEGAAELVHVGQMALLGRLPVSAFVDNVFNFPTLAEAYRVAALDLVARRSPR